LLFRNKYEEEARGRSRGSKERAKMFMQHQGQAQTFEAKAREAIVITCSQLRNRKQNIKLLADQHKSSSSPFFGRFTIIYADPQTSNLLNKR